MLAYLMLHIQVGMRTQTRTEVAIQSVKGGLLDPYRTLFVPQEVLYGPDLVPNNT